MATVEDTRRVAFEEPRAAHERRFDRLGEAVREHIAQAGQVLGQYQAHATIVCMISDAAESRAAAGMIAAIDAACVLRSSRTLKRRP